MRLSFSIALANNFHRRILLQEFDDVCTSFLDGLFHTLPGGDIAHSGKIEVFGEAVIAEIAFLESSAALEYQSVSKCINPADTG